MATNIQFITLDTVVVQMILLSIRLNIYYEFDTNHMLCCNRLNLFFQISHYSEISKRSLHDYVYKIQPSDNTFG